MRIIPLASIVILTGAVCTMPAQTVKAGKSAGGQEMFRQLMSFFDQKDANRDGFWSKEEIISAYGLPKVNQALKLYDDDQDGRVSRAEYEDWARENADDLAAERDEAQREYEEAIKKYQAALAKANKETRERIQRQIKEARERFNRRRNDRDDRRRNLDRRDRRRKKR